MVPEDFHHFTPFFVVHVEGCLDGEWGEWEIIGLDCCLRGGLYSQVIFV